MGEVNAGEKKRGKMVAVEGGTVADGRTCGLQGCIRFMNAITADIPSLNAESNRLFRGLISFSVPFIHTTK